MPLTTTAIAFDISDPVLLAELRAAFAPRRGYHVPPSGHLPASVGLVLTGGVPRMVFDRPTIALVNSAADRAAAIEAGALAAMVLPLSAAELTALADRWAKLPESDDAAPFRQAMVHCPIGIEVCDGDGRIIWINPAFEHIFGYSLAEARGRTPAELLRSTAHDKSVFNAMRDTVMAGKLWRGAITSLHKDGHPIDNFITLEVLRGRLGQSWFVAIREEIPGKTDDTPVTDEDLRRRLSALRRSQQRYKTVFESADDAMFIIDYDTAHPIVANRAAQQLFQMSQDELRLHTGRTLSPDAAGHLVDEFAAELIEHGRGYRPRYLHKRKDGTQFWSSIRLTRYRVGEHEEYLSVIRDVSPEVQSEIELARSNRLLQASQERLIQSARLAQLGELAAGVAHEVNNPAQFVSMNLEALQTQILPGIRDLISASQLDEIEEIIADSLTGVQRIKGITAKLLPFARVDEQVTMVDLHEVIREACRLAENELRHRAQLTLSLHPLPQFAGRHGQLVQVLTNLLINAAQAIDPGDAERNHVRLGTRFHGGVIQIWVEDTGRGVPDDVRGRIFDPFFTTRSKAGGSGLGLPLCSEIALSHGGTMFLASTPGEPTRMEVHLPVPSPLSASSPARTHPVEGPERGSFRVLVVDDETTLLKAYRRTLGARFDVITASSGAEALRLLQQDPAVDAILLDVMMPVMSGERVFAQIQAHHPHLAPRVVFCTGAAFTAGAQQFLDGMQNPVLRKPVDTDELVAALRSVTIR